MQNSPKSEHREMLTYVSPGDGLLRRTVIRSFENLSGRRKLKPLYEEIMGREIEGHEVWTAALEVLKIEPIFDESILAQVPEGPLVIIGNHPFGIVDGLILGSLAARLRPGFHFLVHEALIHQDARLAKYLLPVDFRETKEALQTNLDTRNAALRRLAEGEALAIFPGGGVATAKRGFGPLQEFEWKRFVANVIHRSQATVLPVYFHGRNSRAFQLISQFSATARLGFLLHEIRNKIGKSIPMTIGKPIPYDELKSFQSRQALVDQLYWKTMALGNSTQKPRKG